jgi:hypothetical protein
MCRAHVIPRCTFFTARRCLSYVTTSHPRTSSSTLHVPDAHTHHRSKRYTTAMAASTPDSERAMLCQMPAEMLNAILGNFGYSLSYFQSDPTFVVFLGQVTSDPETSRSLLERRRNIRASPSLCCGAALSFTVKMHITSALGCRHRNTSVAPILTISFSILGRIEA